MIGLQLLDLRFLLAVRTYQSAYDGVGIQLWIEEVTIRHSGIVSPLPNTNTHLNTLFKNVRITLLPILTTAKANIRIRHARLGETGDIE